MHVFNFYNSFAVALPWVVTAFDRMLISWTNHFATRSWIFDYIVYRVSDNNLLKGGLFLTVVWAFWFRRSDDKVRDRTVILAILAGCVLALSVNKILQVGAPHRLRPYIAGLPGITFPYDLGMVKISSFPSDHASLFFALSAGLCFLSMRTGIFAVFYTIIVICLPRIYLGLHYPSDLLAGMFIGGGSASIFCGTSLGGMIARPVLAFSERRPALFHGALFLFTYQLATLFDDIRALGNMVETIAHHLHG